MKIKIKKKCIIISIIFLFIVLNAYSLGVNIEKINIKNPSIGLNGTILYVGVVEKIITLGFNTR